MSSTLPAPLEIRAAFKECLRELRTAKFPRARDIARALDIEENRYTRYERGEVQPTINLVEGCASS